MPPLSGLTLLVLLALAVLAAPASATHRPDVRSGMNELWTSPNHATNSDLAFWGDHAFVGYYGPDSLPRGGFRIFDISNPGRPRLIKDVACDGLQADPIVWTPTGTGSPTCSSSPWTGR